MTSPLDHIAEISAWLAATDIAVLELSGPDGQLRLERGRAGDVVVADPVEAVAATAGAALPATGDRVVSIHVGHLLRAHPLHETPLAETGQPIAAGQTIALIQIGPLLLPVVVPRDGTVTAFAAADGQLVGYGDTIATLNPV